VCSLLLVTAASFLLRRYLLARRFARERCPCGEAEVVIRRCSVVEANRARTVDRLQRQAQPAIADIDVTLARMIRDRVPGLSEEGALHFVAMSVVIVAGLWPFANPTEPVQAAIAELRLEVPHLAFPTMLRETLTTHLAGVLAREQSG
jgi:hypothetical protein